MFEALQAQLAATQRERDALKAELEASTGERTSPKDAPAAYPQGAGKATNQDARDSEILGQTSKRNGGTPAAAEAGGSVGAHAASGLRRPQTRSTTGALPRGSLPQPAGTAQIRARVSPKISLAAASGNGNGTVEAQEAAPSVSAPGARPSFLKKPTAKRDFFHAPTTAALPSPAVTSAVGSTSVASPARHSKGSAGGSSGAPSTTEALKVPSVRRGATSSAVEGASAKPSPVPAYAKPAEKPQISESSQSSLPRYQSLLRKPSASGQSRTLKPGAFNASAIQAACAVPLPSSPACKLDVASPSPARKPGARTLSGVSSPAASRLRRSADKPVAASSSGETTGTPQKGADSRGIPLSKAAPQGEPPVANAFLSKLAAASGGGLSRIPSLGTSRLKPPGAKAPGLTSVPPRLVTSALPRPSAIDPALVAAACAAPLPGSPKPSKPETLLPRGIPGALEAPRGPSHSGSAGVSKLPTPTGRSLLRPPSSVTTALVRAACVVPLPPSPRNAKLPGPSPGPKEESLEMEVDTVPKCKDGPLAKAEKGRAGKEEGGAVDKGLEGIKLQVADVMEDGVLETVMDAESEGPVTAMNSLSSSK